MAIDDLLAQQKRVATAASGLADLADDPEKLMARAAEVVAMVGDLEKHALHLAAQAGGPTGGAEERVVLTADQRQRIAQETGVALELLVVRDADGSFAKAMPTTQKAIIERLAARQAAEIAVKKATRDAVEKLVKQLKALGVADLDPVIQAIEDDPSMETLRKQQEEFGRDQQAQLERQQGR
jgi:hypothetical protein